MENFNFKIYPDWWLFPLLSFFVTLAGFLLGMLFVRMDKSLEKFKNEFVSLVTFQNGGYLPLILVALLLPPGSREQTFIHLFLFLLGFNLLVWSAGVFYLAKDKNTRFEFSSLFSPPVIATIVALLLIATGVNRFIPNFLIKPAKMFGDCALPLAIFIVGGNLALIKTGAKDYSKSIAHLVIAKMFLLPLLFLALIFFVKPSYEIAFLLLLQGIMPSATSLSVIMRRYDTEDNIISLGVFWTHLVGLLTIPLLLTLFSTYRFFIHK
jgi:predicted permease